MECRLVGVGNLLRGLVLETGRDEHPVLTAIEPLVAHVTDVGDVLHVEHGDPVVQRNAPNEVGQQERPEVADVGVAIHRGAAGVHAEARAVERLDRFDRARQRVAKAEGHRAARVNIAVLAQVLFIGLRRLRDFREAP